MSRQRRAGGVTAHPGAAPAGTRTRAHGTRAKYVQESCRCTACRAANAAYQRQQTRLRAYGRSAHVDAGPVRAHLHTLTAYGIGWKRVAALAGVHASVVSKLLYGHVTRGQGPSGRVRASTATALLAVTADLEHLGDHALVPAVGTQRRLQALVAIGWTQTTLAARLGMTGSNFSRVITRADRVQAGTARAVRRLYDELWSTPVRPANPAAAAAARRRGWVSPLAWDDDTIDDPTAQPDTGLPGRRTLDLAEVVFLEEAGAHIGEIARRLGVRPSTIEQAKRRTHHTTTGGAA